MTMTPREVIERLTALQELDPRIATLDREISSGPKQVEQFTRAVAAVDARLAAIDERVKILRAQVKLRENEAKTAEAKVDKYNEQARGVKTNKEFTAIRSEIANAKLEVTRLEDEILKIMEAVEAQDKLAAAAREDRAREQKKLDAERKQVDAAIDGLKVSRNDLAKRRPPLLDGLPPEPLDIYERVLRARGNAVVPIEQDYCSGCMERLTRNDAMAITNSARIVQCKSCGRIVRAHG
jgi:uncharacterized protein